MLLLLSACANPRQSERDIFFDTWKTVAEESRGYSPTMEKSDSDVPDGGQEDTAPLPADAALSAREKGETDTAALYTAAENPKPLPTEKISLKMHEVDVAVLLRTLARAADQNIMISENVQGKANINIKESPWSQVFQGILRTYGLTYAWEGDIIRIIALEDIDHELKLLDVGQKKEAKKREIELVEPLLTRIIPVRFSDAENLRENLTHFLSGNKAEEKRGSVVVDKHTQSIVIQATQNDLETMVSLVRELDQPTLQILIEAHIVETSKDLARELGIQWGGLSHHQDGNDNYWITPGANSTGALGASGTTANPSSGMAVNFPAGTVLSAGTGMNIGYVAEKIGKYVLDIQLSALQKQGKLNILSSPSITTLDNQAATIESGKDVPFQTIEDGEVKIVFKKAVLSLNVTPHVIDGKTLKMGILTHKDELDFSNSVQGNPTIITKKAETNIILFDGQTTVIGGLSKESTSDTESGVPLLKDIPLLGYLFKGKGKSNEMEELLIFITPHILKKKENPIRKEAIAD